MLTEEDEQEQQEQEQREHERVAEEQSRGQESSNALLVSVFS